MIGLAVSIFRGKTCSLGEMSEKLVFCPSCGSSGGSVVDPTGVRQCLNCAARYQISAPGLQVPVAQASTPARGSSLPLVVSLSVLAVVVLLGAGMAMFLVNSDGAKRAPDTSVDVVEKAQAREAIKSELKEQIKEEIRQEEAGEKKAQIREIVAPLPDSQQTKTKSNITQARSSRPDPDLRYRVNIEGGNIRGPKDAKVTIVMFYDFECPFCERVNGTIDQVATDYANDVQIVYMNNPLGFHKAAMGAAKAAEAAASQGKFLEMHQLLFKNRKSLTRATFDSLVAQLGLNKKRFDQVFDDPMTERKIKSEQDEARRLKAHGVPSFFINGRFIVGAQAIDKFKSLIDEELAVADRMIANGTARSAIYSTLMKEAKPEV